MIDTFFLQNIKPLLNETMGVELVSPLIYSLVRMTKPIRCLEIGSGYTTIFILKALYDNKQDYEKIRSKKLTKLSLKEYYKVPYKPKLICIDNDSSPQSTSSKVLEISKQQGLDKYLEFHKADFVNYSRHIDKNIDFVWFDCGGLLEYVNFIEEYWHIVNPGGGIILLHSTLSNIVINHFIKTLKLKQITTEFNNYELISLLEPHKFAQNSLTMIRITSNYKDKYYTFQP